MAEIADAALKRRQQASRIELGSGVVLGSILRELDALFGGLSFAFELGEVAVDVGQLAIDRGHTQFNSRQALLRILHALFSDLVGALHQIEFRHALTIDGSTAFAPSTFDTPIFGQSFNALGIDVFGFGVKLAFLGGKLTGQFRALGCEPRLFFCQRNFTALDASLPGLCRGHAFLLLFDSAAAAFDLIVDVALNGAFRRRCSLANAVELALIGGPRLALEQGIGFQ